MQDFNYHTHTRRCKHADLSMSDEDFVTNLVDVGIKKMAFTDHAPQKEVIDTRKNMRMDYSEREDYLNSIKELRNKYKDIIDIESGYEIEYLPGQEDNLFELKSEVDKIILGQHFILNSDKTLDKKLKIFRYQTFTYDDLVTYAKYIDEACRLGLPDIIVHPDLFMLARDKFGSEEESISKMILNSAEKYQIPIEINLTEPHLYMLNRLKKISYPCREFWKLATEYDVRVLYGIDAHYDHQIKDYELNVNFVNDYLGDEIIKKLKFIK